MHAGAARPASLALGSAACAGLVWLHIRYLPLSAGAMVGLAIAATGSGEPGLRSLIARPSARWSNAGEL
jgi:hypothetical protein